MAPQMNRRELLALGIAIPFTTVTYKAKDRPSEERGPRDSDDREWDEWLDKDDHHLD